MGVNAELLHSGKTADDNDIEKTTVRLHNRHNEQEQTNNNNDSSNSDSDSSSTDKTKQLPSHIIAVPPAGNQPLTQVVCSKVRPSSLDTLMITIVSISK